MEKENITCCECIHFNKSKDDAGKCTLYNYYVCDYDSCANAKKKVKKELK
jgi:hypothetical protein